MSVLRHLLLVLGVSLAAGQMSPPPPPSPAPPPPRNTNTSCSQSYCTSPDPYGGTDCWAGSDVEACTCSRGTARETGSTEYYEGKRYYEYTCCENGEYNENGDNCGDYNADDAGAAIIGVLFLVLLCGLGCGITGCCYGCPGCPWYQSRMRQRQPVASLPNASLPMQPMAIAQACAMPQGYAQPAPGYPQAAPGYPQAAGYPQQAGACVQGMAVATAMPQVMPQQGQPPMAVAQAVAMPQAVQPPMAMAQAVAVPM